MASAGKLALLVLGFSFTAGFIDLLTLVRFTQFAGMQTGNMILIGRDLYRLTLPDQSQHELLVSIAFHVATLMSHFAGVMAFCAVAHWCTKNPVRWGAILVGTLTICGALLDLLSKGSSWSVCLVAASMGAMNFIPSPNSSLGNKLFLMTVLTTGNLQKSAKMCFKFLICHNFTSEEKQQWLLAGTTIIGTIVGALIGALALYANPFEKAYGESLLLLLVSPLQVLLLCSHDAFFRPPTSVMGPEAVTSLAAMPGENVWSGLEERVPSVPVNLEEQLVQGMWTL